MVRSILTSATAPPAVTRTQRLAGGDEPSAVLDSSAIQFRKDDRRSDVTWAVDFHAIPVQPVRAVGVEPTPRWIVAKFTTAAVQRSTFDWSVSASSS